MPELVYMSRRDWGVDADIDAQLRRRYTRAGNEVVCGQIHHTASVDAADSTPNRWTLDRALRYTRALQRARPDLMPMPYNETVAVSEDLETVWIFEGCGLYTVGAHTSGHNRHGYGISVYGNFDRRDDAARDVLLWAINERMAHLKAHAFPHLGTERSPNGWLAWGHRDSKNKSCPGSTLYPAIPRFVTLEEDMALSPEVQQWITNQWKVAQAQAADTRFQAAWDDARNAGMFSAYTEPATLVTTRSLATFLLGNDRLDIDGALTAVEKRLADLAKNGGSIVVDLDDLANRVAGKLTITRKA
jgi:hypothetical protein